MVINGTQNLSRVPTSATTAAASAPAAAAAKARLPLLGPPDPGDFSVLRPAQALHMAGNEPPERAALCANPARDARSACLAAAPAIAAAATSKAANATAAPANRDRAPRRGDRRGFQRRNVKNIPASRETQPLRLYIDISALAC